MNSQKSTELRDRILLYLEGDQMSANGNFTIAHSGSMPIFGADREGFIHVGIALLRYALEAERDKGQNGFKSRSFKNMLAETSEVQTLVLQLDEAMGSRAQNSSELKKRLLSYLEGAQICAGGNFRIDHSGRMPLFCADREGFTRVGVALLRYALEAERDEGPNEFKSRSLKNMLAGTSRAQTFVLHLDEELGLKARAKPSSNFVLSRIVDVIFGVRRSR